MTTKTTPAAPAKRERTKAEKTAGRWLAALAAVVIPALILHAPWLAAVGVLGLLVFAAFRLRKIHHRWRSGGKPAMRHRAKFQGHATLAEIRRNLSHDQGVPIGTVRSTR
jgi:membrane protein implicated in regulation of membrane protease activity